MSSSRAFSVAKQERKLWISGVFCASWEDWILLIQSPVSPKRSCAFFFDREVGTSAVGHCTNSLDYPGFQRVLRRLAAQIGVVFPGDATAAARWHAFSAASPVTPESRKLALQRASGIHAYIGQVL
mmetsp:Transcript_70567/g.188019  ORF Transcript_70567/g.188019 Transcript_70567/m.188019 type:complete len:126 (-) Transcript_70567:16-393(-)